jgi:hypothetical protein
MSGYHKARMTFSHSVGLFGQHLNDHLLIVVSPSLHHRLRVRVHNRIDIVDDVLLLSAFVMQGNAMLSQRRKRSPDIKLRSAGDAYTKVRKVEVNELLDKSKNLFTRRRDPRPVWTLVERVKDDVYGLRMGDREHILETLYHFTIAGLCCTIVMCRIKAREDVATRRRLRRKLNEEGREEVATMLLVKVPEVEIKVRHQG